MSSCVLLCPLVSLVSPYDFVCVPARLFGTHKCCCEYPLKALVAFSGEVIDTESSSDPFTENSMMLNPNLKGCDIREAFKDDEYPILLVANKFQTGFDQPLLCGMARALLNSTAIQTGLRSNELRSLTRGKLNLTDAFPFVVAKPGGTKNKKLARQYMRHSDIRLTMDRYGHLFPGSEAEAIERIRGAFTQPLELRKTGTADPQQFQKHSGCDSVRVRCETLPLANANPLGSNNEKTPRFPEKNKENTGFLFSEVDGGRTRNLRIDSPVL